MAANTYRSVLDSCLLSDVRYEIGLGSVESKVFVMMFGFIVCALKRIYLCVYLCIRSHTRLSHKSQVIHVALN